MSEPQQEPTICGARTVFWPDVEACEAECIRPLGHDGRHEDEILGEWNEDELLTITREGRGSA